MFQRRRWNAAIQSTAFQPPLECIFSDDNYNEPSVSFRSLSLPFFVPFIHYCLERNDFGGRLAVQINAIKRKRERERLVILSLGRSFEAACGRRLNCGSISERERGHGRTRHISTHESPGNAVAHGRYLDEQI